MSDQLWYYADRQQIQRGPVSANEIAALFRQQGLDEATLVWREGLPEWQPLAHHFQALGLAQGELTPDQPPPLASPPAMPEGQMSPMAGAAAEVVPAGFARRFGALVIDSLILSFAFYALLTVLVVAVLAFGGFKGLEDIDKIDPPGWLIAAYLLMIVAYYVAAALYYSLQESGLHQATFGKRAMAIKVTDLFGRRLVFSQALGRWAAAALGYLTCYVGFLMAAFTERKQALHDLVAGTLVVDRWAYTDSPHKQSSATSGCLVAVIVASVALFLVFLIGVVAAISIPAYQDFTIRAKVAEALSSADSAKVATQEFIANTDRCPRDIEELGLVLPDSRYVSELAVGENDGRCTLQIELANFQSAGALEGKRIWLELQDDGQWQCSSDALARYLPASCR